MEHGTISGARKTAVGRNSDDACLQDMLDPEVEALLRKFRSHELRTKARRIHAWKSVLRLTGVMFVFGALVFGGFNLKHRQHSMPSPQSDAEICTVKNPSDCPTEQMFGTSNSDFGKCTNFGDCPPYTPPPSASATPPTWPPTTGTRRDN